MDQTKVALYEQVDQLKLFLLEKGYSPHTIRYYSSCWNTLMNYAGLEADCSYSKALGEYFLSERCKITPSGNFNDTDKIYIQAIRLLETFVYYGVLPEFNKRVPLAPKPFMAVAEEYVSYLQALSQTHKSIKSKKSRVKQFLNYLDDESIHCTGDIDKKHLVDFMAILKQKYSSAARSNILYTVKDFLIFCETTGYLTQELSGLIKCIYSNPNETLPTTYNASEIAQLLLSVDRSSAKGKKDYAILILASQLGIRSSDILNLMLNDIKWSQNTIEFYQCKSGVFTQLPLLDNVKYALLDYLKNSRPDTEYPHLFVRSRAPIKPYKESAIAYLIVSKQMRLAGIHTTGKRHGPHSLRHSMATGLLEDEAPLPVIAVALGHNNTKNTSRYLRIDIERLRSVALEVPV